MHVRSKLLILALTLSLVLIPSVLCSASPFELVGGGFYTTLTLTDLNDAIEDYNNSIEQFEQEGVSVSKMNKINQTLGVFGGARLNVGNRLAVGGTFDTFSAGTGTEIDYDDQYGEIDLDLGIDLSVSGLVGTVSANINDYIGLNGGAGYYFGTVSMSASATATGDYSGYFDLDESESADLSGFGFKAGGHFNYPVNNQLSLYTSVNYRILELATQIDNSLTNDTTLNANGVEVRFGISFGV
ncbi:hypothetical protein K9M78_00825 [Candidatus Bipolaricaulota bacterium]|nr:hypothetical protein [Candidatus Bipolaricaulota bacterium]